MVSGWDVFVSDYEWVIKHDDGSSGICVICITEMTQSFLSKTVLHIDKDITTGSFDQKRRYGEENGGNIQLALTDVLLGLVG